MSYLSLHNLTFRGPIWICINYLTLRALHHYKSLKSMNRGRLGDVYTRLRTNIMTTVLTSMKKTGYFWEHYDDSTGEGTRGHPFTGWTSLIVNIMAEKFD
jgi:mannosyl-oligosaccharide glucosidase